MAVIQVRARVKAFVGGALRHPEDDPFSVDGKDFNPEVLERVEPAKPERDSKAEAEAKAKVEAETKPEGDGKTAGESLV